MNEKLAKQILKENQKNYNLIAEEFSQTRNFISNNFKNWIKNYIAEGEKILDWGCGNGRFCELFSNNNNYYGIDFSEKMIAIAQDKYPFGNFKTCLPTIIPYPNDFFDKIFSLAVFHHLPSKKIRIQFLKEAHRVLKPNGLLILTVWNMSFKQLIQSRNFKRLKLRLKFFFLKLIGKNPLDFNDIFIPWNNKCQRYIHCFTLKELEKLSKQAGFKIIDKGVLKENQKESNLFIILQKI
ncbi:MAG TPA: class I SAM-dependent methyltransferase [Candidatus Paceibacterota bacterium]|nr:class I SAM-dependent methyltransferase [Candidatus Paceibacterota bacterium]HPC37239.1 class I SAM-dependent methyltransferase [Candidatus Paceibacterota bacterium]HRU36034.1 class I SAM-dependent methyltransferase [Candidatus Paceibacterota bacterium]